MLTSTETPGSLGSGIGRGEARRSRIAAGSLFSDIAAWAPDSDVAVDLHQARCHRHAGVDHGEKPEHMSTGAADGELDRRDTAGVHEKTSERGRMCTSQPFCYSSDRDQAGRADVAHASAGAINADAGIAAELDGAGDQIGVQPPPCGAARRSSRTWPLAA